MGESYVVEMGFNEKSHCNDPDKALRTTDPLGFRTSWGIIIYSQLVIDWLKMTSFPQILSCHATPVYHTPDNNTVMCIIPDRTEDNVIIFVDARALWSG